MVFNKKHVTVGNRILVCNSYGAGFTIGFAISTKKVGDLQVKINKCNKVRLIETNKCLPKAVGYMFWKPVMCLAGIWFS